jgi:transposase-like protein
MVDSKKYSESKNPLLSERIERSVSESGKTDREVMQEMGVSSTSFYKWIRSGQIDRERIPQLAEVVGKHPFFFLEVITGRLITMPKSPLNLDEVTEALKDLTDAEVSQLMATISSEVSSRLD